MTTTVAELFTLMAPYIRACVAFNYTPRDGIGAAEAEVTASMEPLKAALDELIEERDRLRFELDGVNAMREIASDQPHAVPDGWRLAPIYPTREMCEAWEKASSKDLVPNEDEWNRMSDEDQVRISAQANWQAMLAAAPQPPAGQQDRGEAKCETCGGRGQVTQHQRVGESDFDEWDIDCPVCDGIGHAPEAVQKHIAFLNARIDSLKREAHDWWSAANKASIKGSEATAAQQPVSQREDGVLRRAALRAGKVISPAAPANGEGAG